MRSLREESIVNQVFNKIGHAVNRTKLACFCQDCANRLIKMFYVLIKSSRACLALSVGYMAALVAGNVPHTSLQGICNIFLPCKNSSLICGCEARIVLQRCCVCPQVGKSLKAWLSLCWFNMGIP